MTNIEFNLPDDSHVTLTVYNIIGQKIFSLVDQPLIAGTHRVAFDARDLKSGVYIYQLRTDNFVESRKMMLMK